MPANIFSSWFSTSTKLAAVGSAVLASVTSLASGSAGLASEGDSTGTLVDSVLEFLALRLLGAAAVAGGGSGSSFFGGDFCCGDFCGDFRGDFLGDGGGDLGRSGGREVLSGFGGTGESGSRTGLASTLLSLSTVTGASGSGASGAGGSMCGRSVVLAIMAAMSSMVSAEPERVFLRACGSGGGDGGFSGPFRVPYEASPFSSGGCAASGDTRGGVAGLGASAGGCGGGGTGTRMVRSGFLFRLEPGGAPQESAES